MDRFEQLISDSQIATVILGNPASGDYQTRECRESPTVTSGPSLIQHTGPKFLGGAWCL